MLRDEAMGTDDEATGWAATATATAKAAGATARATATATSEQYGEWQDIDRELRSIARRQAGLDAELMRALREAERVQLWRHLGCISMMEYLERVFGYSPRVAQERLRTARKLESLPELATALADNELSFSAVRELSRVATPQTERVWRGAARGKCLREIEELVSGHEEGDLPSDTKKPEISTTTVSFHRVRTATCAKEREARRAIEAARGERIEDDAFLDALYDLALSGGRDAGIGDKAKYQIVRYHCTACSRTEQLGGGKRFPIDEAEAERGECDAEHVSLDPAARATQDIPKQVRRFVELRDSKRCRVPGCRSAANLEVHHIVHREDGGTHDPENLAVLCGGHHHAHHDGTLYIAGTSSNLVVRRFDDVGSGAAAHPSIAPRLDVRRADDVGAGTAARPSTALCLHAGRNQAGRNADAGSGTAARPSTAPSLHVGRNADAGSGAAARPRTAPQHVVAERGEHDAHVGVSEVGAPGGSRFQIVGKRSLAIGALRRLGWKMPIAVKAVDGILHERGTAIALDELIRAALPRCSD